MKVMITGKDGFLGHRLRRYLEEKSYKIAAVSHQMLDLTCADDVAEYVKQEKPDILIHCAAISDVGVCGKEPERSYDVNVNASGYLADSCRKAGAKMIFCSSDQVYFGGNSSTPHGEGEKLFPPHVYGREKLEAEERVLEYAPGSVCLRLSWMYDTAFREGQEHSNLFQNMKQAWREHGQVFLPVYDQRSITNVWDVVGNMEKVFELSGGIYNYGSENTLPTYELMSCALKETPEFRKLIVPNREAFAGHPRNIMMDCSKIRKQGIAFPSSLERLSLDFAEWYGNLSLSPGEIGTVGQF